MANDYTTGNLPDPLENAVRRVLRGTVAAQDYFGDLYSPNNEAIGNAGTGVLMSQGWGDGAFTWMGVEQAACEWRVPRCGDLHSDVQCEVYASATGAGMVRWTSGVDNQTNVLALTAGAWFTAPLLDIGAGGPTAATPYDDITLSVMGVMNVSIETATIRHIPVASPIPAGVINDISPMGASSSIADGAMTAAHGRRWSNNITEVRRRPRVLLCWSGLDAAIGGAPSSANSLARRSAVLVRRGAFDLGRTYHVHIKAIPDPVDDTTVVLKAGGAWGSIQGTVLTIPGGGATDWYSTTIQIPEAQSEATLLPFDAARIGFWPAGPGGSPSDRSDATILGASIWGE